MNHEEHGISTKTFGLTYNSRNVQLLPNCFWAFRRLSNSVVQFEWLKLQFVSEFEKEWHFLQVFWFFVIWHRRLLVFQYNFRLFQSSEWNVGLKYLTVWNRVLDVNWRKHCNFQQPLCSSALRVALNFVRRWLFCSPRLVYQMFSCRSSTAFLTWFCKPGISRQTFHFPVL